MLGWHFAHNDWTLGHGDGRRIVVGETITVDCDPVLCQSGLHASRRIMDALRYATGSVICRVQLGGRIVHGRDKSVATERTVIAAIDGGDVLHDFARRCALDVVHLWDCPDVVVRYLRTGDDDLRDAAYAAARDAARSTARDAGYSTASAAAYATVRIAGYAAARDAARDASYAASRVAVETRQNRRLTSMVTYAIGQGKESGNED